MSEDWLTRRRGRILSYIPSVHLAGVLICAAALILLARNPNPLGQDFLPAVWVSLGACLLLVYWAITGYVHRNQLPQARILDQDVIIYILMAFLFAMAAVLAGGVNTGAMLLPLVPVTVTAAARGRLAGMITAGAAGLPMLMVALFSAPLTGGVNLVFEENLAIFGLALLAGWLIGGLSNPGGEGAPADGKNGTEGESDPAPPQNALTALGAELRQAIAGRRYTEDLLQAQQHIYQAMLGALEDTVVSSGQGYEGMRTLADLTTSLLRTGYEEVVAERVLEVVCDITGAASGCYFKYEEMDGAICLHGAAGRVGGLVPQACESLQEIITEHLDPSYPGLRARRALYLADLGDDPRWKAGAASNARSCYLVPLYHGERLFGVYAMLSNLARGFGRERQALADTLASFVSTALENARLFGEAQHAYERLNILQQQLLHSQKLEAMGKLAGGVAHEVNNQLTVIRACIDLYDRRQEKDEAATRIFFKIRKAAEVSANLSRKLLQFGRQLPQHRGAIDLNQNVAEMREALQQLLDAGNVIFSLDLDADLWPVNADSGSIDQVLVNLVINARDAMPHGGVITVRTRNLVLEGACPGQPGLSRAGRFVCLSVADTGTGMDEVTLSHLFEPFYTTKEEGRGTGLGLSVAYGIVNDHEGWFNVLGKPGQGSCFEFYLPALAPGAPS